MGNASIFAKELGDALLMVKLIYYACMELCRNNIDMLLRANFIKRRCYQKYFVVFPAMLDGELVSLFGIIRLLHHPEILWEHLDYYSINVLTLLLYLLVRCQSYLHYATLDDTMNLVRNVHNEVFPGDQRVLDRLILKLTYRSLKLYIKTSRD